MRCIREIGRRAAVRTARDWRSRAGRSLGNVAQSQPPMNGRLSMRPKNSEPRVRAGDRYDTGCPFERGYEATPKRPVFRRVA